MTQCFSKKNDLKKLPKFSMWFFIPGISWKKSFHRFLVNFNNQACLAKISSVRPVVHKNLSGNIMVANQISQIQKSINSGLIQTVIDEKNVKIPYVSDSEIYTFLSFRFRLIKFLLKFLERIIWRNLDLAYCCIFGACFNFWRR